MAVDFLLLHFITVFPQSTQTKQPNFAHKADGMAVPFIQSLKILCCTNIFVDDSNCHQPCRMFGFTHQQVVTFHK